MSLAEAPLPVVPTEVRSWTLTSLEDLAVVRAELEATLPSCHDADHTDVDDVMLTLFQRIVLVASELATNALRHGVPPVTVHLLCSGGTATLDVVDRNPEAAPVIANDRAPGAGGFGLVLAHRAAQELGWFRKGDDEKHVWARFSAPQDEKDLRASA